MTAGRLSGGRLSAGRYRTGAEFAQAVIGSAVGALCGIGHYHGIEFCFFDAVLHKISHSLLSGIAGIRFPGGYAHNLLEGTGKMQLVIIAYLGRNIPNG